MMENWKKSFIIYYIFIFILIKDIADAGYKTRKKDKKQKEHSSQIINFDEVIQYYIDNVSEEFERSMIPGEGFYPTSPSFRTENVKVTFEPMKYGKPAILGLKATYVYTHWFHNRKNAFVDSGLRQKSIACGAIFTWKVTRGLKISGHEMVTRAEIPKFFSYAADFGISLSTVMPQSSTLSFRTSFSAHKFNMKPLTSFKVDYRIPVIVLRIPWETTVYLGGSVTVDLPKQFRGSKSWNYPVWWLSNDNFPIVLDGGNKLSFKAKGTLAAIWYTDLEEIHSRNLPLQPNKNDTFLLYKVRHRKPTEDKLGLCVVQ